MSPDRAERVADLVASALEQPTEQRKAFVASACADDPTLAAEVESLLGESVRTGFIERPAYAQQAHELAAGIDAVGRGGAPLTPGTRLGAFEILSLIGEGGMGEVYLAQDHELRRQVALKLVKRGVSASGFRHFLREERILAQLTDPHIARLYGGGLTPDGQPYFVMEHVAGRDLDEHCRAEDLGLRARLELFRKVCAAVAHAHQNLVIHRDLKPANIRVTAPGEPKLLDFGIAKVLQPEGDEANRQTMTMSLAALTPAYASPEQLRGDVNITTASDIYSLGVVLYELLAGRRPYETKAKSTEETARLIERQEPPRPSAVAPAETRRALTGDLDNIVLRALRAEPERRYASAAELGEDIRRHLEGLPVRARRETRRYVLAKFVRRNRAATVAAALVLLALVGGLVATLLQARRAERERERAEKRFEEVRRLANALIFEIHDSVQNLAGSLPTRRLIVSRALEYLERLGAEAAGNAPLQRELAAAYEKIGEIQGNPYGPNLGDTEGALASYRKAEAIRAATPDAGTTPEARFAQAMSARSLGDIFEVRGDFAAMEKNYRRSLAIFEELARAKPDDERTLDELARALETLGDGLSRVPGSDAERLACYERSLAMRGDMAGRFPPTPRSRLAPALAHMKVGNASMPDLPRAAENLRRGVAIAREVSTAYPDDARARRAVNMGLFWLGNALRDGNDTAGALEVRREVLVLRTTAAQADPNNTQARFDLAVTEADVAEALLSVGRSAEAVEPARRAVAAFGALAAADANSTVTARNQALAIDKLAIALTRLGADESLPAAKRRAHWTEALALNEQQKEIFAGFQSRGALRPEDAHHPALIDQRIAECRAALAAPG